MKGSSLFWKVPLAVVGSALGLVLVLLIAVGCVLYVHPLRYAVLDKAIPIVQEQTGYDIDLGDIYLSPFHHSPMVFYRAYKGVADLPLEVSIDSLFVGHRGQDTLLYARALRLSAIAKVKGYRSDVIVDSILSIPIEVEHLLLDRVAFHSDSLIKTVGVDVVVGELEVRSPELNIAEGLYPLHGLRLSDVYCGIDLRSKPEKATQDTTPLRLRFDVPDGELRNIHFALTPLDLHIHTGSLSTEAIVDVGANCYDTRRLEVGRFALDLGQLHIPVDTVYGIACADIQRNRISSGQLHARSDELGARADLSASTMNLNTMRLDVAGKAEFQGSQARLRGYYDIDDETYAVKADIEKVDLSPFLKDSTRIVLAGTVEAKGRGVNPKRKMQTAVRLDMTDCKYGDWDCSGLKMDFCTDTATMLHLTTPGLRADMRTPMNLFPFIKHIQQLTSFRSSFSASGALDTLRHLIPDLTADIALTHGSPLQHLIDTIGLDIRNIDLRFSSDTSRTDMAIEVAMPEINHPEDSTALRLPAAQAGLRIEMQEGHALASLKADTKLTDGAMMVHGLKTDADLWFDVERQGDEWNGTGRLTMKDLSFGEVDLGSRTVDLALSRSEQYEEALRADIRTDDMPLEIVDSIIKMADIDLSGAVRAQMSIDGMPERFDLSAEVLPIGVRAEYKPYEIGVSLGETPIVMKHKKIDLNGLPVYGVDSTYLSLRGGIDLNNMQMDISLQADSFAPVKLAKDGPFPVYGELATDLRGSVTGPLDSLVADVDVTLLPVTDITYPIDKKNLAQVKPHGMVNVRYAVADSVPLNLGGQINVDDGLIRFSPKIYPIMPFHVDSGSNIAFNGPVGQTMLDVSASQKVKADVQSEGEETRRVDFRTGVRVNGVVDSIGFHSIDFFLEAPDDETITRELGSLDEDTREGLAATLLATGMYVGESNAAQHKDGYALSSIINSRINAAMANSKMGKVVDIDVSNAQTKHAGGTTNDMNISISKSFFKDRFRITIGSTLTDNPEVNQTSGLFTNMSAEYKLTKDGNILLRAYADRDYNNILEGELYKYGLGVRAMKDWRRQELYRSDTITRTYGLTADAGVAYRSNNSIGPDVTLKSSVKNLMGRGETFTLKANGAYYWALRNRHPGDPKKTDTYKLGATASLIFPYLHWLGDHNPDGDTRYMLGYQYENIAGGYGVHKLSGSFTYFIKSSRYITHAFTPFSLSVVLLKTETDSLLNKAAEYPQLIKVIAGNEFVPSIGYTFTYNDYRSNRVVNTLFEVGIKESGNLINAFYCAFGQKWNDKDKTLGSVTFNQFVKLNAELRNKFNITDKICFATRLYAGANIPLGNSYAAPLSEAFYAGGPNGMRAVSPYAYGPGNFYSEKYNQNFFHAGDVKLEANFEFRFPIVWKLYGATFLDAGNVWNWYSADELFRAAGIDDYKEQLQLREDLYDGIINNPKLLKQIALGTGAGLRLDLDGLVIRLDIGVAIHAPYQTYKYDRKTWKPDFTKPINTYFNIPSALDAIRVNFGIGYPF